ncbi:MAG: hypothetical protein LBH53_02890 [Puniceicoccales bacterium]|jgi:hypothetical protein|nr:hypothetical protein [Puniceicoccales bacterium]
MASERRLRIKLGAPSHCHENGLFPWWENFLYSLFGNNIDEFGAADHFACRLIFPVENWEAASPISWKGPAKVKNFYKPTFGRHLLFLANLLGVSTIANRCFFRSTKWLCLT